jgi:hypothetical protein
VPVDESESIRFGRESWSEDRTDGATPLKSVTDDQCYPGLD